MAGLSLNQICTNYMWYRQQDPKGRDLPLSRSSGGGMQYIVLVECRRLDSDSVEVGPPESAEGATSPSLVARLASLYDCLAAPNFTGVWEATYFSPGRSFRVPFCFSKSSSRLSEKTTPFGVGRGLDWAKWVLLSAAHLAIRETRKTCQLI